MNITFDFDLFRKETKNTLLNPKSYFSRMKNSAGMSEPILKALMYGLIAGIIYLICWLLKIKSFVAGDIGEAVGLLAFIKIILGSLAGLFLASGLLFLISSVCQGITAFEVSLRVSSSLMALLPVYAILSILSALSIYIGILVNIVVSLYFLWLLYPGLVEALKCRPGKARFVCWVFFALFLLIVLLKIRTLVNSENSKLEIKKPTKELRKN
jgi:hypothetical protein